MLLDDATLAKESADLLAHLIRNECVNDGTPESGYESRSTDVLAQYLGDSGLDLERYSARPGRENLVARIEGSDPKAPTLFIPRLRATVARLPVLRGRWPSHGFTGGTR